MARKLYIPLETDYYVNEKFNGVSEAGEVLYLRSMCLAKSLLTDGVLTRRQLGFLGLEGLDERIAELVQGEHPLWREIEDGDGWLIIGFLKRNRSAAEIDEISEKRRQAALSKREQGVSNLHSNPGATCDPETETETETKTSTTNTQNARGGEAGVGTANGRGYDARALKALERWNELDLALPATVSEHDHMRRLTLLFTGPPKAWKTTEIFAAMQKLKDAPDEWGWVLSEGPGYLAHQPRGKRQVIEQVLTKTRGGRSGRETADARADRLMAEMEADDARTG